MKVLRFEDLTSSLRIYDLTDQPYCELITQMVNASMVLLVRLLIIFLSNGFIFLQYVRWGFRITDLLVDDIYFRLVEDMLMLAFLSNG